MDDALKIAKYKYDCTTHTVVWILDQRFGYTAFVASQMIVNPGGKQPQMHVPESET